MPQEELDLLQLASRSMAEPSTGPSQIAKQLGVGVGTAYRAYQELSKNPRGKAFRETPVPCPWLQTESAGVAGFQK